MVITIEEKFSSHMKTKHFEVFIPDNKDLNKTILVLNDGTKTVIDTKIGQIDFFDQFVKVSDKYILFIWSNKKLTSVHIEHTSGIEAIGSKDGSVYYFHGDNDPVKIFDCYYFFTHYSRPNEVDIMEFGPQGACDIMYIDDIYRLAREGAPSIELYAYGLEPFIVKKSKIKQYLKS